MKELYLDNAASTKPWKEVIEEAGRVSEKYYGNPSSLHRKGEEAFDIMSKARKAIAKEINCLPEEIIFTSGATESNNLAILGSVNEKNKIIISSIEHPSVRECAHSLKNKGYKIVEVPVDREGIIDVPFLKKEVDNRTIVSIIHANNIIGSMQDLNEIGKICRSKGAVFHTDAVQSFAKTRIDCRNMGIDMLSASAHKIGGLKGTGFLYCRKEIELRPIIMGGGQEKGVRSGTENIPGIAGFSKAIEMQKKINYEKVRKIRDQFIKMLEIAGGRINGSIEKRMWNNIHVSFPGIDGENLAVFLSEKGIYVSVGSACDSKREREDHVLKAIRMNNDEIKGSIRITIDYKTSMNDVSRTIKAIEDYMKICLKIR